MKQFTVYIGNDHHGFDLKVLLTDHLAKYGYEVHDVGSDTLDVVDYPKYASLVAQAVSAHPHEVKGILLCGTGAGVCIVANKFKHVRAGLVFNEETALRSRHDDDCNIICLPADYIADQDALAIIDTWLKTPFSNEDRYQKRVQEIDQIETKV